MKERRGAWGCGVLHSFFVQKDDDCSAPAVITCGDVRLIWPDFVQMKLGI